MQPLLNRLEALLAPYPNTYPIVLAVLTASYGLRTTIVVFLTAIISNLSRFDAERILPPLIMVLTLYLTFFGFYRMGGRIVRTGLACLKWSLVLTSLAAFAGYVIANTDGQGHGGEGNVESGFVHAFAGFVQEMQRSSVLASSNKKYKLKPIVQTTARPKWRYPASYDQDGGEMQRMVDEILNQGEWW